tara:strand:- start:14 stop:1207 length:1194 start_codon:yes stop_codon:yes gene_type:complete
MYFQTLDDKTECVGVYKDGSLHFEKFPEQLLRTWRYTGSIRDPSIEYAWIICQGKNLKEACPPEYEKELEKIIKRMEAFYKSFKIAKINMREHCLFDLIPQDSLLQFCEIKNKITEHVFSTYERPQNYEFLNDAYKLLFKIREQSPKIDTSDCRSLLTNTNNRRGLQKIVDAPKFIDYNLFGTVTGRLATYPGSFPILTMKKELRCVVKPRNDWFLSLDYNGAEVRTVLSLLDISQPDIDIHEWNIANLLRNSTKELSRDSAKTMFFAWLYNPDSDTIKTSMYDREAIIEKFYKDDHVTTVFNRKIKVDKRRALSYLIQSTTSDLVLERAVALDKFLHNKKSFISHIVHDEVVVDLHDSDRGLVSEIRDIFSNNKLDKFMVNLSAGKNYYELSELKI